MHYVPDKSVVPHSVTIGFAICMIFFTGVLCLELVSGEGLGIPAKRTQQPIRYWVLLSCQAALGIVFVAVLYFLTR